MNATINARKCRANCFFFNKRTWRIIYGVLKCVQTCGLIIRLIIVENVLWKSNLSLCVNMWWLFVRCNLVRIWFQSHLWCCWVFQEVSLISNFTSRVLFRWLCSPRWNTTTSGIFFIYRAFFFFFIKGQAGCYFQLCVSYFLNKPNQGAITFRFWAPLWSSCNDATGASTSVICNFNVAPPLLGTEPSYYLTWDEVLDQ